MSESVALRLDEVGFRYPGGAAPALESVTLEVARGGFTSVLGPNGAGKSTLVRLAGGSLRPCAGEATLLGRRVESWERAELARRLAVVAQDAPPSGIPMTVQAYVELGRNPYVSPWAALGEHDRAVVEAALSRADLTALRSRAVAELSGGERQRAKIARALAQEPEVLLLDEPTVHLDLRHALWVFRALRDLVDDKRVTVLCITHDINMASRFADEIALLARGRLLAAGTAETVLDSPALAAAYECEVRVERSPGLGHFVLPMHEPDARPRPA